MDTQMCIHHGRLRAMKDVGIRIRVERDLRNSFALICQTEGRKASDVLREFMQTYVDRHHGGQGDLFAESVPPHPRETETT